MSTHRGTDAPDIVFTGCSVTNTNAAPFTPAPGAKRREVVVKGRRVKTVDVHAHCFIPEAVKLSGQPVTEVHRPGMILGEERIRQMDHMGIDVEALSINPFWYRTERDVATDVVRIQKRSSPNSAAGIPTASWPSPRSRCSFPSSPCSSSSTR